MKALALDALTLATTVAMIAQWCFFLYILT